MLKTFFRRSLLVVLIFIMTALAVTAYVYAASAKRIDRNYAIQLSLPPANRALLDEGRRLARSRGCADCHGDNYAGRMVLDKMPFARLVGSNLTRMPAGREGGSMHERIYRALRHGVDMDSRPLLMMPSKEFARLSAREIEAIAAYLGSLAPIARALPDSSLGPVGRGMLVAGKLDGFLSAEVIDHAAPTLAVPPPVGTL